MKSIKGPFSLNRELESHKYDIEVPMTNSGEMAQSSGIKLTLLICTFHASFKKKKLVQRMREKVIQRWHAVTIGA